MMGVALITGNQAWIGLQLDHFLGLHDLVQNANNSLPRSKLKYQSFHSQTLGKLVEFLVSMKTP